MNFEENAQKFKAQEIQGKLKIATEIRDNVDMLHTTTEYNNFLKHLLPAFYLFLRNSPPQFVENNDQKLRSILLDILHRIPSNEALKPYVNQLLQLTMYLLEQENEDNAVICLRIIIDLHKNYRGNLEGQVQPFLDIVQKIYSELQNTVAITFSQANASNNNNNNNNNTEHPQQSKEQGMWEDTTAKSSGSLIKSIQSFKVLTECPIIVVLLFQLYPRFLYHNIIKFMPLIIHALTLTAPPNSRQTHRAQYADFLAAQVKTLSFLAYMLRSFADVLKKHEKQIPGCVIPLFMNCPPEAASIRKELLIATRHILATDFRYGFIGQIDTLLDEKVLIGSGRTAYETLRPLAYSTLADLVHHVRQELSLQRLATVVTMYSRNIHDSSLPFTIQNMSVKLLLNLVECITKKQEEGKPRALLVRILDTFVNKFISLKKLIPKLLDKQVYTSKITLENIKDCRNLIRTLVLGLKNIVWGISSRNYKDAKYQTAEENMLFIQLLKNGLKCFSLFSTGPNPAPQDEKEIIDHFAAVFTTIDTKIFQDVLTLKMPFLFECILESSAMQSIPQHFLANQGSTKIAAEILLNFLIERLKDLNSPNKAVSQALLTLFKLVFSSLNIHPENEQVLQPYVSSFIQTIMKYATEVADPINYFILLRSLFQYFSGGKFDLFFSEFLPLLPEILEQLNHLQHSSHSENMRDLFVELALTVPVRSSALLPFLKRMIRPILLALETNHPELVMQSLRIFELCVDNFPPETLDPLIEEVHHELMLALWKHLKPSPYPHGSQVLKILGKFAVNSTSSSPSFCHCCQRSSSSSTTHSIPRL